ncbi:MAG: N-formylglutamate amidohydrolase [Caulobacterales bacterium]|nr:N-formylglutamate amidohydrolase [Caulobacterales bacterium]
MKATDENGPAFDLLVAPDPSPLIYTVPHAGRVIPVSARERLQATETTIRSLEDPLVDELVDGTQTQGATLLVNRTARAVVDVNRDPGELDPGLVSDGIGRDTPRTRAGLGVVPRLGGDGRVLWRGRLDPAEIQARISAVHAPYHAALAGLMQQTRARFGLAVLIDWHSMPAAAAEVEGRRSGLKPDIVLGDRFGQSAEAAITGLIRQAFESRGRRVVMNRPFAGGHTTQVWARPAEGFHAVQIEINRSIYLDEVTLDRTSGLATLQADVNAVSDALLAMLRSKKTAPWSAA